HAEEDRKSRDLAEARNNADSLAYQSEKQLKELGEKVPADQKQSVEAAIKAVRDALATDDVDAIKTAMDDLQTKFQAISAELYKQAASQAAPAPESGETGSTEEPSGSSTGATGHGGDKVVDADFEVVDEDKKKNS